MSRHFLIDGYNLLHQMPRLRDLSLESGREALAKFIRENSPQGSFRNPVTIVFDGSLDVAGEPCVSQPAVVFSRGESADDVLRRMCEDRPPRVNYVVVTDDRALGQACRINGAEWWPTKKFLDAGRAGAQKKPGLSVANSDKNVSYATMSRVNQELARVWLKPKS